MDEGEKPSFVHLVLRCTTKKVCYKKVQEGVRKHKELEEHLELRVDIAAEHLPQWFWIRNRR